jgi:site-specific DNA-methyltransferase (adenine-specific)
VGRVLKPAGVVAMFSQQPFTTELIASNRKQWRYELIWHKPRPTGFLWVRRFPLRCHEHIQVFAPQLCRSTYNPQFTRGKPYELKTGGRQSSNWGKFNPMPVRRSDGRRYPRSVIEFANSNNFDGGHRHPTQKPEDLMRWLVRTFSNAGDVILDCFMGSGTTGAAAIAEGRRFVGIEKNRRFFSIASKRINQPPARSPRRRIRKHS